MKHFFHFLLLSCLLAAVPGCSTFNYEWRQAVKRSTPTDDITGRWQGRWVSKSSGHEDKLRALIAKVDTNHYDVKFHAAYKSETFKFITIHFGYTVRMTARTNANGSVVFNGSENLGPLAGGVYTYEGSADPTNFFSSYDSKYDRGTFQMQRPRD